MRDSCVFCVFGAFFGKFVRVNFSVNSCAIFVKFVSQCSALHGEDFDI